MSGNGPETNREVAVPPKQTFSLTPNSLDEAMRFAELMAKSDLVPREYQGKPGNVLIAVQMGAEVGLSPMQAIQSIAVINGRPSLWGDGLLGVVQAHPDYEWHDEKFSTDVEGVCVIKRKGHEPYTVTYTLEDAKRAGLLGKQGPWQSHTKRMLQLRARAFCLRDKFADALKGLGSAEEAIDIEAITPMPEAKEPLKRPTLLEKLKQQVEPALIQPPETPAPDEPTQAQADLATLYADHRAMVSKATTIAAVSEATNKALDDAYLTPEMRAGIRMLRDERMKELQPPKKK